MEDYIFKPNSIYADELVDRKDYLELYTLSGQEDYIDSRSNPRVNTDGDNVLAKRLLRNNGTTKYSIRLDSNNKLFNPISIYDKNNTKNFLERVCRSDNKFTEVNAKTFEMYIQFLKTKNVAYLHNAERESE